MATFECNDIDGFCLSMEEFANIPDSVVDDILRAGAEVVKKAHVNAIAKMGQHTRHLIGSPAIIMKRRTSGTFGRYALVYPQGVHHTYRKKAHSYTKYNWGRAGGTRQTSAGEGTASNAEVAFIQEFGGHGNTKNLNWMRDANEKSADATTEAEARVYDKWLKSINL